MIIVHHLEKSRSHRVLWLLEELGVPYQIKLYKRDPKTRLAPPELKTIHPLGKSPVIADGALVLAESAPILEYLAERYGPEAQGEAAHLFPQPGTDEQRQWRFWMHYAEGSLMNWLLMQAVFTIIPTEPMPFFVRPIAEQISEKVSQKLVDPNIASARQFIESHLATHKWFAGDRLTLADFQMSYPVEGLIARSGSSIQRCPHLLAYKARMTARPAYQRALAKGGPVLLA